MVIKSLSTVGHLATLREKPAWELETQNQDRNRLLMPSFKHLGPAMPEVSNFSIICKDSLLAKSNEAIFFVTYNQRFMI